ncbi:MAG TPA: DUF1501 domain-containing protein [Chloroflexota bacterium]|nr:DUF1501 domain-containing protein [Chloroflexota bacterium]
MTSALTSISRRGFIVGCGAAAFVGSRISEVVFASGADMADQGDVIITVFLRGGWDVMNVVPPVDGPDRGLYEAARPSLKIANQGDNAALRLDDQFGLHPAMGELYQLYQAQKLAIVHAVGLNVDTRSHFEAQQYVENATPGVKSTGSGWVGRHLASLSEGGLLPAVAAGGALPTTLAGAPEAVSISAIDDFDLRGDPFQKAALRHLYDGDTWLHTAGAQTFQAIDTIQRASSSRYEPANGAVYPNGGFGANLKTVAKLMKLGVGLRAATVDLGGWDTHQAEGEGSGGYLSHLVAELSDGLGALYTDLDGSDSPNYADRMTLVVVSEFGRRLSENASRGTDHGHGSGIFVLGGQVNGGRVISNWPGLQNEQLYDRADLAVTIDYRQVLGEILVRRLGNPRMAAVFPGYKDYQPLGIVRGTDLQLQA